VAGRFAAEAELKVWYSPFRCEPTPKRMLSLFAERAGHAEKLRRGRGTCCS
jgi:hypothetical protein